MPPLDKPTIQITILDDSHTEECQAGCSIDWSSSESLALARQQVKERFGDRVKIEYLNMSRTATNRDMLQWREEIRNKNFLLPLLLLNGQLRISGPFDFRQLMDTIEVEVEVEGVSI
jgi:disulfide oxidoreductase YuzD